MSNTSSGKQFLKIVQTQNNVPSGKLASLVLRMSFPAILAQISSIVMQYIDASMVGHLGADKAASVGLVSSSIWLVCGLGFCLNTGYYVQVAQQLGAKNELKARSVMMQGYLVSIIVAFLIMVIGISIAKDLPVWLGGSKEISSDATIYFGISCLLIPFLQINRLSTGVLQSSGNMKLPSILNILVCVLDVIFNFIFIFESNSFSIGNFSLKIPGFGLGVMGAAIGTLLAELFISIFMLFFVLVKSKTLHIRKCEKFKWNSNYFKRAFNLSLPIGFEHTVMCGAMVVSTIIVSSLGSVSIAAHSFAITAESFCYMSGYGIASAASAMMGQTIGAMKKDLAVHLAWVITFLGVIVMSIAAIIMYIAADLMISIMIPDYEIQKLGASILRVVAWAEPLFAASIVISGTLRGSGDTLVPSCLNFCSMWLVRIPLSFWLASILGLYGVWVAMSIELSVRGIVLLVRLKNRKWLDKTSRKDLE